MGTRYIVLQSEKNLIEAVVATGKHAGKSIFIARITKTPSDNLFTFTMRRKQFPIRPAFVITANKSQGQTLTKVGIPSTTDVFTRPVVCFDVKS